MNYYIGADIGTSGTKTVLFDVYGKTIASSTYEYEMRQPKNGWAEQDPDDWWRAVCQTISAVISKSQVDVENIKGVGLSGQMHGLVMLDKNGESLRQSIIWCDQRTSLECEQITRKVGAKRLIEITANPALTGFTASKILWVKKNEPDIYEKTKKILLPKDYIRYKLTGEFATEVSDASGMQLLDIKERKFSKEVLGKLGIDPALLGQMYESYEITGTVTEQAAALTGLKPGTPVVGGAGDQAAGAVGNGIVKKGVVSSTIGTSGVIFAHSDEMTIDPLGRVHTFCHAVPGKWHVMGVTQAAGLSLKWLRDNFFKEEIETAKNLETDPYILMDKEAELVEIGAAGLIFLPYLMGERTPHLDAHARGVFFGISAMHTKRDFLRAVLEGVVYSLKDCYDIIGDMGIGINEVRASGGGGKSRLWRQMQADVFGCRINTINSSQGPALGAAILAMTGTNEYSSVEEACENIIKVEDTLEPSYNNTKKYKSYHDVYKRLYIALKDEYKAVNNLL